MNAIVNKATTEAMQTAGESASKAALTASPILTAGQFAGGASLAAITGTIVSYLEYKGEKENLKDAYKKEIAAQLGKVEKDVTVEDLELISTRNGTIRNQLTKAKRERNFGIGIISVATLASVSIALAIKGAVVATAAASGFVPWLATTAIATLAYMAIKDPLKKSVEKIFGIDRKTTHERIEKIGKDHEAGKVISDERVFAVFVHANPQIGEFIKARFGKEFDKLAVADKMAVTGQLGELLKAKQVTEDINQGRIRATELAFSVEGDYSGVLPTLGDVPKHSMMGTIKEKLHHAAETLTGHEDKPAISFAERELARRAAMAQLQETQR